MRKRQKIPPNPLKMRIFLSKLANYSPISTKTLSPWENWGKFSVPFFKFSYDFCQCTSMIWLKTRKFGKNIFKYKKSHNQINISTIDQSYLLLLYKKNIYRIVLSWGQVIMLGMMHWSFIYFLSKSLKTRHFC